MNESIEKKNIKIRELDLSYKLKMQEFQKTIDLKNTDIKILET